MTSVTDTVLMLLDKADKFVSNAKPYPRTYRNEVMEAYGHLSSRYRMHNQQKEVEASGQADKSLTLINLTSMRHSSLVADVSKLEPIYLKDMYVNKVHKGKYLLCKTLSEPFYSACMVTMIRDENGEVEHLRMYNCSPGLHINPALLLPANSILIIKEPFLIGNIDVPEDFFIRVESPSDLVIVSDLDYTVELDKYMPKKWLVESNLTYEQLNAQGNKFFADKNYYQAVRLYTQALNWCAKKKSGSSRDLKKTLNNRSLANLRLERYFPAYQDALKSSQIEMENSNQAASYQEKSYFRMGKALYCMREYSNAIIWFTKCVELNPESEACAELARAKQRVLESETGQFNTKKIIEDCKAGQLRLDVGDYVCPDIEVSSLNNNPNFKGVVAKADIKRNTLLVATKSLSVVYDEEVTEKKVGKVNHQLRKLIPEVMCQNVQCLINKMQYDPFLARKVYKLYAGANIDRDKTISESVVDSQRIENVVWLNAFSTRTYDIISQIEESDKNTNGIFFFPAFFNQSCVPNVTVFTCSDLMMIYSMRDIKKGEELTLMYLAPLSYYERRLSFFESMCFKCNCRLCELDSKDSKLKEREAYLKQREKELEDYMGTIENSNKKPDLKLVNQLVKKVRQMYADNRPEYLKTNLVKAIAFQAKFYLFAGETIKGAYFFIECFEMLKNTDNCNAIEYLFEAIDSFSLASLNSEVKKWLKIAKLNCRGDKHIFEHVCRTSLKRVDNIDKLLKQI